MFNIFDFSTVAALSKAQEKQPVLPLGNGYVPPVKPKAPSLFVDEQKALDAMKADGISESEALSVIKDRRKQLLPESKFGKGEAEIMEKMRAEGVNSEDAANALSENRKTREDVRPLWKKAGEAAVDTSLGALSTVGNQIANLYEAASGDSSLKNEMAKASETLGDSKETTAFKVGQNVIKAGEMAALPGMTSGLGTQALVGGLAGATSAVADKGKDVTLKDVGYEAALGAALPIVASGAGKLLGAGIDKTKKFFNPSEAEKAVKALSENERLIQGSITPEKLTGKQVEKALAENTGFAGTKRVTTGKNIVGGETISVNPTKRELDIAKLADEAGVKFDKGMTRTDKIVSLESGISREGDALQETLKNAPLIPKKRVNSFLKNASEEALSHPEMQGQTERNIMKKYMEKFKYFVQANEGSASGLLQARKEFDSWVKSTAGEKAFQGTSPASIAIRTVRENANRLISELHPEANVLRSLERQNALYNARDAISTNAKKSTVEKLLENKQLKSLAEVVGGGTALYELNKLSK